MGFAIRKKYLTFDELLNRWQCGIDDIAHAIMNLDLIPSYFFSGQCEFWIVRSTCSNEAVEEIDANKSEYQFQAVLGHLLFLQKPSIKGPKDFSFKYLSEVPRCFETGGELFVMEKELDSSEVMLNGVVTLEEIERFEKLHCTEPSDGRQDHSATEPDWPWGSHHTELLGHLDAAARRYWVNYDPQDNTTAPTNKDVSAWLQNERGLSETMANSIASILRADGLPTGPRK